MSYFNNNISNLLLYATVISLVNYQKKFKKKKKGVRESSLKKKKNVQYSFTHTETYL